MSKHQDGRNVTVLVHGVDAASDLVAVVGSQQVKVVLLVHPDRAEAAINFTINIMLHEHTVLVIRDIWVIKNLPHGFSRLLQGRCFRGMP